ncbi:MAG: ABC transporter permease [Candidatus Pacebacteria bacterium]|nr:ABC transporter permease [Candidatus Paceibacterota bacterium]
MNNYLTILKVGSFLAVRQIRRASKTTTALIIFVMTLTFLNLVVVSGILVGLIEGSVQAYKDHYTGEVIISTLEEETYIENSPAIVAYAERLPWVKYISARYVDNGTVEAGYKTRTDQSKLPDSVSTQFTGIDPVAEDNISGLGSLVVEGEYLSATDYDQILLGYQLINRYLPIEAPGFSTLDEARVGDKLRVEINGALREVTVKGIIKAKVDEIGRRVFFVDSQLRNLIGRSDYNVDEIVLRLNDPNDATRVKEALLVAGFDKYAKVQTWQDAQPKFLKDIINTFALLGNVISSIGLAVASITIFIVIFINAITRRKFIGILKGIGIDGRAIEFAYVLQSLFYALFGTLLGIALVFLVLKPYFAAHPIDFPFSDGILVATWPGVMIRAFFLFLATLIAGYIPAKLVVRQNTLDSILGR